VRVGIGLTFLPEGVLIMFDGWLFLIDDAFIFEIFIELFVWYVFDGFA
jgi:hypothetical protein